MDNCVLLLLLLLIIVLLVLIYDDCTPVVCAGLMCSGGGYRNVKIENKKVLSVKEVKELVRNIEKFASDFIPLNESRKEAIIGSLSFNSDLLYDAIPSIRNSILIHKSMKAQRNIPETITKKNILKLSEKYKIPPSALAKNGDWELKKFAANNDVLSAKFQRMGYKAAMDYEKKVEGLLNSLDIEFVTEEFLRDKQIEECGYAYATPDFLLKKPIKINGKLIHWIDAKNFFAFDHPFVLKMMNKTITKYNKYFGSGALIFGKGMVSNLKAKALLLTY